MYKQEGDRTKLKEIDMQGDEETGPWLHSI